MEKERALILQMVADGKITAAQGVELLKALEGTSSPERARPEPTRTPETPSEPHRPHASYGPTQRPIVELPQDFGVKIGSLVESLISNFGFGFGNGHKFEDTFEGQFDSSTKPITLDFSTVNGRIAVETWDRPHYMVRLIKHVRTGSEQEAKRKAEDMGIVTREPGSLSIKMQRDSLQSAGMAIVAYVPKELVYSASYETANGRIEITNLQVSALRARTSNGIIKIDNVSGGKVDVSTSNGKVMLKTSSNDVRARTSNGRIVVVPIGEQEGIARYDLDTSNGSIRVRSKAGPETGFEFDLQATNGKIETEAPDLEYQTNDKQHGFRKVQAKTRGFETKPRKVIVNARTSNGKIIVGSSVEWD